MSKIFKISVLLFLFIVFFSLKKEVYAECGDCTCVPVIVIPGGDVRIDCRTEVRCNVCPIWNPDCDIGCGCLRVANTCGDGGGEERNYCYGEDRPPADKDCALGTTVKFVLYPNANSVPYPGTSIIGATNWVENIISNTCLNLPAKDQLGIVTKIWKCSVGAGGGLCGFGEANYKPQYPSCTDHLVPIEGGDQAYPGDAIVGSWTVKKKFSSATWYNDLTSIQLPADSPYRQFGIKITEGLKIDNTPASGGQRPIYNRVYSWKDTAGQMNYICNENSTSRYSNLTKMTVNNLQVGHNSLNPGGDFEGGGGNITGTLNKVNCTLDKNDLIRQVWPGFPSLGINQKPIYMDHNDKSNTRYGFAVQGMWGDDDADRCIGTGWGTQAQCPSGYVPVRAGQRTRTADNWPNCMLSSSFGNYTDNCLKTPGDGGEVWSIYDSEDTPYHHLPCPRIITCKRDAGYRWRVNDWKPEHSGVYSFTPDLWNADDQADYIVQKFRFTVDKTGGYYFVKCANCDAGMHIYNSPNPGENQIGSGWDNHSYTAGQTYSAIFLCRRGDCYYGLGLAPKNTLPTSFTPSTVIAYLVYKVPPTGTITGTVKKNETSQSCNQGNAEARQVTITAQTCSANPNYSCTLTSTGGTYSTDSCSSKPPVGCTYNVSVSYDTTQESCLTCPSSTCSQVVSLASSSATANFTVFPFKDAWFQTQEGDVHSGGDLRSKIPSTATQRYFSLNGEGGHPGVVSYPGTVNFGQGSVSAPPAEWLAKTSFSKKSYDYFYQILGSPTLETPPLGGSITLPGNDGVVAYNDDIKTGGNWNVGTKKIVILTEKRFLIKHRITIGNGGSLVVIAREGIGIFKNVGDTDPVQGIFLTDGTFSSSTEEDFTPVESKRRLVINGGVIAGQVDLRRDLEAGNSTLPAEQFLFRPDFLLNSHQLLWRSAHTWEELAP